MTVGVLVTVGVLLRKQNKILIGLVGVSGVWVLKLGIRIQYVCFACLGFRKLVASAQIASALKIGEHGELTIFDRARMLGSN